MAILFFSDILRKIGINPKDVRLIRHAYSDKTFRDCADKGMIYEYTRHQKKGFENGYRYWAVFVSGKGTLAQFYALYEVGAFCPDSPEMIPDGLPESEAKHYNGNALIFNLTEVESLKEYENKLTIEWGPSARSWWQKGTTEKEIISLSPDEKKVFMGYDSILLSYDELKEVIDNPNIYEAWHTALKAVNAVYLISDMKDGKHYVGSAYGEDGLLGRWRCYVETGHGNNKKMMDIINNHPDRYHAFQFAILQILPKTIIPNDVVKIESLWKNKLLSIKFGLNDN